MQSRKHRFPSISIDFGNTIDCRWDQLNISFSNRIIEQSESKVIDSTGEQPKKHRFWTIVKRDGMQIERGSEARSK
jgi:hypothetical protein